jgi:hypothetical protein
MRAEVRGVQIHGVIHGKPYFVVRLDYEAWQNVFTIVRDARAIPDWWLLGPEVEKTGLTNAQGGIQVRHWYVLATTDPAWFIDAVKMLLKEREA